MVYYVYILHCSDDSYYTGVTNSIDRRFLEHQNSHNDNSYTSKRLPVRLVYHCSFSDINQAILFEKRLKKWSRSKKEALIEGRFHDLPLLSKKKFKKV
jgi:putative endonuclease